MNLIKRTTKIKLKSIQLIDILLLSLLNISAK